MQEDRKEEGSGEDERKEEEAVRQEGPQFEIQLQPLELNLPTYDILPLPVPTIDLQSVVETHRQLQESANQSFVEFYNSLNQNQDPFRNMLQAMDPVIRDTIYSQNTYYQREGWFQEAYTQPYQEAQQAYLELEDRPALDSQTRLDALDREMEVPHRFYCIISHQCMEDPVYFAGVPEAHFDYRVIEQWLAVNATHPLTREPVTLDDVVHNEELRQEIDDFIEAQEAAHAERPRP